MGCTVNDPVMALVSAGDHEHLPGSTGTGCGATWVRGVRVHASDPEGVRAPV